MRRRVAFGIAAMVMGAACGGSDAANEADDGAGDTEAVEVDPVELPLSIANHGGDLEGHGPRGFAGQGVGLFAGDNLNQGFPEGEGIQIWLSFDLPPGLEGADISTAVLRSSVLQTSGAPFDTLGDLLVEPVEYESFEPELFDLPASGDGGTCVADLSAGTLECDVSDAVQSAVADQAERAQFRLKFEQLADNDGEQDLVLFFTTDSNSNESGIFTLDLS